MTATTPIGVGAMPTSVNTPNMGTLTSQNLFEHMAHTSSAIPQGTTPAELGAEIMNNLDGFIDRVQNFSTRINGEDTPSLAPDSLDSAQQVAGKAPAETSGGLSDSQFDRMIESLSAVFDHSIETQMVVRGATQVSGSANTLLRGQ